MSETMLSRLIERVGDQATGQLLPTKVAEMLSMSLEDLVGLVNTHRKTPTPPAESPEVQERLSVIVQIIAKTASLQADPQNIGAAAAWFRYQPIAALAEKTAEELVREGLADAVARHLEALTDGLYA